MSVARHETLRRGGVVALEICAVTALYYASGKLGLIQQLVRGQVSPLWPPTGIALAGLLLLGPRIWPGIALGALLVNISLGPSVPAVLAIMVGNTLAPLCSYLLLRRAGFRTEMDRLRDALVLVFLGAFTGTLVSATVGSGTLFLAHALPAAGFWPTWSVWWTGDAMGVLLVAPVLLVLYSARPPKGVPPARWAEGLLLLAATVCVGFLETAQTPLLFLGFPLLIWAAFRFQRAGAAPCALAVSIFAIAAAARKSGPFAGHDLLTSMISLQAFNGSVALTALLLAAAVTERNQTQKEIERACGQLAEMVARITSGGDHHPTHPDGEGGQGDESADGGPTPGPW
ncbi:membrane protein [Streptomyces hygroscopicus]|uniref:MASE1 domain-containing protein n=1 Tax=Streptomyces hygroscopicus TaxID=1912 RepID=UPI0022400032|nr:MASE1 domain-containing protein [Streptomyces hygroscopicus]MCW7942875.1 membrane protein [Streptomyces hygroscopicus]